jgi:KaiC/GvpD/RAD55 family RecA-like ATPase
VLLNDQRVVVISGPPGIGKTTLAEMLLFTYLEQGYEPVVIQAEISEDRKFFCREAKRIFYYDDFLGQINLGDRTADNYLTCKRWMPTRM